MSYPSTLPDLQIPDVTVPQLALRHAGDLGERTALVDATTGDSLTFAQTAAYAERVAAWLAAEGVGKGDRVMIFAPNLIWYPVMFHGIALAGAISTTANALYTGEEIAHQLADSGARTIFTISPFLDRIKEAVAQQPVDRIVVIDGAEGYADLRTILGSEAPAPQVAVDPATDLATLPYSSGTTGLPKGVMLSHRNLVSNVAQCEAIMDEFDENAVVLAVLPFFHIYGLTVLMNLALARGARLVTMPRFDLEGFLGAIAEHKVTRLYVAPPILVALAKHPIVDNYDLSSLRSITSGAAPLDEKLALAVEQRIGVPVRQGFGMTELSPVSHAVPDAKVAQTPAGSVGYAVPNVECRLVDPDSGNDVGPGEPGELWVRGPNVMVGYLGNDKATAETIVEDGWLRTGDIAEVTDEGVYTIVDRLKELIKYKGYQVAPAELEALLLTNPDITDSAVIGVPDTEGGEIPKAFVVRRDGGSLTEDDVMAFVAEHVAPHKKVRQVQFVEAVPKSASGKILRKDLRALEGR
ncbi:AMP-binding protein [Epidermidibacterium keratini]|uniref:AMP-binding protein n=1 Tax=Epidermidibacterium keratini TaxID=1891644 RepID=A0A7L4YNQ0_9ACTN|nr:4-coumarate--CoA ligase family protein [Epidermidibacterium keratini]QHC00766.1 AMP-binding protein [Epidermidibacterium keratini]